MRNTGKNAVWTAGSRDRPGDGPDRSRDRPGVGPDYFPDAGRVGDDPPHRLSGLYSGGMRRADGCGQDDGSGRIPVREDEDSGHAGGGKLSFHLRREL